MTTPANVHRPQISDLSMRVSLLCFAFSLFFSTVATANDRPNIVWIVVDDMSSHFGYQGERLVKTPHVDRLAAEGVNFANAYATAPVCSTFRSAMITGMYQTTIGSHHHRSGRGEVKIELPRPVRTIPELFKEAGYYTTIADAAGEKWGKQDYNFEYDRNALYDGIDYNKRAEGQPFFAQYHLRGGKLRNIDASYEEAKAGLNNELIDPAAVTLPPYYPDHPAVREDWAQYLDSVNYTDVEVGRILDRLKDDDVLKDTIIFFLTDHGISHARGKQFLYEEGIHIPFIAWGPNVLPQGLKRDCLVAHIDLGATSLQLAGIEPPNWMQGRPLFGPNANPREFVVSARDRCDETVDRIRSVREGEWKYIRNFYPERPYLQPNKYKDAKPFMPALRELYAAGKLNDAQSLQMAETRPEEELYNLSRDPWELNNLADDPAYAQQLAELRCRLSNWVLDSDDRGRFPEPESMYDSDMEAVLPRMRKRQPEEAKQLEANIRQMKQWKADGK